MYSRRGCLLALAVVAWAVTAVAQPDVTTLAGTIQAVDLTTGRLTLRAADGSLTALHTSATFLTTLQPGDAVEVLLAGPNALIIHTPPATPPPGREEPPSQPSPEARETPPPPDTPRHEE